MEEYAALFAKYDEDGGGEIGVTELGDILAELGHKVSDEELQATMRQIDVDGSGEIDFDEFLEAVHGRATAEARFLIRYAHEPGQAGAVAARVVKGVLARISQQALFSAPGKAQKSAGMSVRILLLTLSSPAGASTSPVVAARGPHQRRSCCRILARRPRRLQSRARALMQSHSSVPRQADGRPSLVAEAP
jgi:hypothetical protein